MMCYNHNITGNTLTRGSNPSNVIDIVREWVKDINRRFRRLRGLIRKTVGYENDALHLRNDAVADFIQANTQLPVVANADSEPTEAYNFPTDEGKTEAFIRDLREWYNNEVLEPIGDIEIRNGEHWTAEYLRNSYVKASNTAVGRLMQEGVSTTVPETEELLTTKTNLRTLQRLYTRTYEDLRDIREDMADIMRENITKAYAQGWNPKKTAKKLTKEVRSLQRTRAEVIAQTETITAAAESTVDRLEENGVGVASHASWLHSHDTHVCAYCRKLGGINFTLEEMRSTSVQFRGQIYRLMPAAHPRGRCSVSPSIGLGPDDLDPLEERLPAEMTVIT